MVFKNILIALGLYPSQRDLELRQLVHNSYRTVRVVGRGTIKIDPSEVANTPQFQQARRKCKQFVS